jgi:transcription termination/antitermination protein NusG
MSDTAEVETRVKSCEGNLPNPLAESAPHPSWYALYVQVNHEWEVQKRLEQKSIEHFLPSMECWSKRKDRRKRICVPLFPGYVFVRAFLDNHANVQIVKTPGALSILRNSEGPLSIPDDQINCLKTVVGSSQVITPHTYLKDGDLVRVKKGALEGCVGVLVRQDAKRGRLVISIDIIRQAVAVELDIEDVEPIKAITGEFPTGLTR